MCFFGSNLAHYMWRFLRADWAAATAGFRLLLASSRTCDEACCPNVAANQEQPPTGRGANADAVDGALNALLSVRP